MLLPFSSLFVVQFSELNGLVKSFEMESAVCIDWLANNKMEGILNLIWMGMKLYVTLM